ncbi:MAG: hypothetical protein R3C59_21300 [Planctomycetaceae bacterium]
MTNRTGRKKVTRLRPTIAGAGLVALDAVQSGIDYNYFAGGTCGNVLTVLSYLGWNSKPIARLKADAPAKWLTQDMSDWGVDTEYITTTEDGSTPVIIQRIREDANGNRTHSFSLRCPCCGSYLPGYKAIRGDAATELSEKLTGHQVFFFDRVSRGTLNLAHSSAERGAVVVFEPSGVGDAKLFREAWSVSNVVKYSNDRLRDIADIDLKAVRDDLLLEIETLGASGLRYRSRIAGATTKNWKVLKAIQTPSFSDAAGSGDWCTAGLIHKLCRGGLNGLKRATTSRLTDAIRYGQALAAWNCGYEGARGGMYQVSKNQFEHKIRRLLAGKAIRPAVDEPVASAENLPGLCSGCDEASRSRTAYA